MKNFFSYTYTASLYTILILATCTFPMLSHDAEHNDNDGWEEVEKPTIDDWEAVEQIPIEAQQIFDAIENREQEHAQHLIEAVQKQGNGHILNETGKHGDTLLHAAVEKGFTDIIPLLTSPDQLTKHSIGKGLTPLQHAAQLGNKLAVIQLIAADSSQLSGQNAQNTVNLAQEEGHTEIVKLLKQHGAPEPTAKAPRKKAFHRIKKWWRGF